MTDRRYSERIRVPSYLCGPDDYLGFDGAASLLQEAAWQHAQRLGFAFTEEEISLFWVLHRVRIRFLKAPTWDEMLTVTTWPSGMERLYALREVTIDGEDGVRRVDISSAWIILDAVRRRPVRPENHLPADRILDERLQDIPTGRTDAIPAERVPALLDSAPRHAVRPSDTDRNRHVNNVRYLQWLQDAAPDLLAHTQDGLVSFLTETHVGQEYTVISDPDLRIAEVWTRGSGAAEAQVACRFQDIG